MESGLGWTVDMQDERDFIGRARCDARAPRFSCLGLVLLDKGVLRAISRCAARTVTEKITSGSFSPTLGCSIALARLPSARQARRHVEVQIRESGCRPR